MEATLRLLQKAFEKSGITIVDPKGMAFDPELHEAMTVQETDAVPEGTVLEVFQKGYVLNGRLLRPARVIIAKAPA
jgi:molecular chaperone GrpE